MGFFATIFVLENSCLSGSAFASFEASALSTLGGLDGLRETTELPSLAGAASRTGTVPRGQALRRRRVPEPRFFPGARPGAAETRSPAHRSGLGASGPGCQDRGGDAGEFRPGRRGPPGAPGQGCRGLGLLGEGCAAAPRSRGSQCPLGPRGRSPSISLRRCVCGWSV